MWFPPSFFQDVAARDICGVLGIFHIVSKRWDENSSSLCVCFGYRNFSALFSSVFFTDHPLLYVRSAMDELDAAFLAAIQKSNYLDVYERHSIEVQRNPRLSPF
jgi:hypothetical protein